MEAGWSAEILLMALGGAVFHAFSTSNDNFIMHHKITHPSDSFVPIAFYLLIGSGVGIVCLTAYNPIFGNFIEPNYSGFKVGSWQAQRSAMIAGSLGAVSTMFYLWGNKKFDPSLVLGLSGSTVLFLSVYDSIKGRLVFQTIIVPVWLLIIGAGLTSIKRIRGGLKITIAGLLVLFVGRSLVDTTEAICRQIGGYQMDAVNFCFWRFIWQAVTLTILVLIRTSTTKRLKHLLLMRKQLKSALPWIILTMFFVFLSNALFQKAIQTGLISKTRLVMNSSIALGVPITLVANRIFPGIFGEDLPRQKTVWVLRALGVLLIVVSVALLAK